MTDPLHIDFHLLDRQIVDHTGAKIGKVDDVELSTTPDGRVVIAALLVGQRVLGQRIGGWVGRWLAAVATRMRREEDPPPLRIAFEHVTEVDSEITIGIRRELLPTPPLEAWLQEKLIGRIPGAGDASR
jgi:sporulation protein YlmC with PRC-barrel domain